MIERYTLPEMSAVWSERRKLERWQEIEALALEGWAAADVVPAEAAAAVRSSGPVDIAEWKAREESTRHDVAAFVDVLASAMEDHGRWLHFGLTSSDVLDTALAWALREASDIVAARLDELFQTVRRRALEHRHTTMVGRTHGMWAEVTTFGVKLAGWAFEVDRNRSRFRQAASRVAVGKLSGAVGTYAIVLPEVEELVCARLGLEIEPAATQVVARDRHAELLTTLAVIGGMIERFAVEIRHLQRSEVGEVAEPFSSSQKGSSSMPHKRNPIGSENLTGLARLLRAYAAAGLENIALWHERDISHSSVERVALPDAFAIADFALNRITELVAGLVVDEARMEANLAGTMDLVFSQSLLSTLVRSGLDRDDAYRIVQRASAAAGATGRSLADVVKDDPDVSISSADLEAVFDIEARLQRVGVIFDRLQALDD